MSEPLIELRGVRAAYGTIEVLHGIDLAFELPRLRRCFLPADANHAVHIIREMFSLSDYAMYVGPRDVVPVIADRNRPQRSARSRVAR